MMQSDCDREQLRDFAFDELAAPARAEVERHLAGCAPCAAELAQIQLTTAALHVLPEREIPQRIAFVSDKVFEPGLVRRSFARFWRSSAQLVFASACLMVIAAFISTRRPGLIVDRPVMTRAQWAIVQAEINKATSEAVSRVHEEDARVLKAALESANRKSERQKRELMVAMDEQMSTLQKRLGVLTEYAMAGPERNPGSGQ
jgi:anti-sigma factor RsiW